MTTHQDHTQTAHARRNYLTGKTPLTFACIVLILGLSLTACSPQEAGRKSRAGRWTQFEGNVQPATSGQMSA